MKKRSIVPKWLCLYLAFLAAATALLLCYIFLIPHSAQDAKATEDFSVMAENGVYTENTYQDPNIQVTIEQYRAYDTDVYVADIRLSSASYLKSGLAENTFGRNIKETTSEISQRCGAVVAIDGDFYGTHDTGYVLRNGVAYRNTGSDAENPDYIDLVVYNDGRFEFVSESETTPDELAKEGAVQVYAFGPTLVWDGQVQISTESQIERVEGVNPRSAIGMIEPLHYVFVVADGRTEQSRGLTVPETAEVLKDLGAQMAYNLDGGGSATMVFNGKLVNRPTTNGKIFEERNVSDIVYIG